MARIPHCCGCGVGWQLWLQLDPYPENLHMLWEAALEKAKRQTKNKNQQRKKQKEKEKTENYNSDEGERKNPRKSAKQ